MRKKIISVLMCVSLLGSLTACGSSSVSASAQGGISLDQSATTETKSEESTASSSSENPATDTESVADTTKLSGKVVVYCPSPSGLADNIASAFTDATGVDVEMFQGTTGEIQARLETEQDNPIADVVILASWSDGLKMAANDQLMSYTPSNINQVLWTDDNHELFGYSASAVGVIYNTTIFPTLSADWNELGSNSNYQDQIVIPDPTKSGSCKDFLSGFMNVNNDDGQAIIDSWVANGLTSPGANKAALEAVTTGEKGIVIAGVDYNAYSSIAKGEPLGIYYPAGGTVINPRPAMILKTSQNVANAEAFIDFLYSDTAQDLICDAYLLPGLDGKTADTRSNLSDINALDVDWDWMQDHAEDISENLMNSLN